MKAREKWGLVIVNSKTLKNFRVRYSEDTLKKHIADVLTDMEENTELFEALLCSYPSRRRAVKSANGRHTDY